MSLCFLFSPRTFERKTRKTINVNSLPRRIFEPFMTKLWKCRYRETEKPRNVVALNMHLVTKLSATVSLADWIIENTHLWSTDRRKQFIHNFHSIHLSNSIYLWHVEIYALWYYQHFSTLTSIQESYFLAQDNLKTFFFCALCSIHGCFKSLDRS